MLKGLMTAVKLLISLEIHVSKHIMGEVSIKNFNDFFMCNT